jgi:hypothetical protein
MHVMDEVCILLHRLSVVLGLRSFFFFHFLFPHSVSAHYNISSKFSLT